MTTKDGNLVITTRAVKTTWIDWNYETHMPITLTKNYTSGMVQSWNKFCFTGGILELSINLPGDADSGGKSPTQKNIYITIIASILIIHIGLWPAAWLMGNLARATFPKSTLVSSIVTVNAI